MIDPRIPVRGSVWSLVQQRDYIVRYSNPPYLIASQFESLFKKLGYLLKLCAHGAHEAYHKFGVKLVI